MKYEKYMRVAVEEAAGSLRAGDCGFGAVIVKNGAIIATARDTEKTAGDPTAHAEMTAIRAAASRLGNDMTGCVLVATHEPCPMCAGALVNARVDRLVYGCDDPKAGAVSTLYTLCEDIRLNHRLEVVSGVCAEQSAQLLREFFAALRARRRPT